MQAPVILKLKYFDKRFFEKPKQKKNGYAVWNLCQESM
jgi:hypothetical protein